MTWTVDVHATQQRRLFSRVLQVLENQRVHIHSFRGEDGKNGVHLTLVISSETDKAYRIEALLCRLEDVLDVSSRLAFKDTFSD